MNPVGNAWIFYTDIHSKEIFVTKNVFFLLICLHLHLIDNIKKQTFVVKKSLHSFIYLTLNMFFISLQTCS